MQLMFGLYGGLGLLALLLYRPLTSAVEMAEDWLAFASRPERPTRSQGGTEGSNPLSSSRESCELRITRSAPGSIGGDADVVGRNMLCNPVISRICCIADQDHSYVRGARRPERSRAIGDNEDVKPKTSRYAIDLLPHVSTRRAAAGQILKPSAVSASRVAGSLSTARKRSTAGRASRPLGTMKS